MKLAVITAALLFAANSVHAQADDPEAGLTEGHLISAPDAVQPSVLLRPQLVYHDHKTPIVIGAIAAVTGGVSLIASWSLYVARQNYRGRVWLSLSDDTISEWRSMGAWSLWTGVAASALLVTSEYLLLPESNDDVPVLAWVAGAVGLGVAAVGIGFAAGGTHCAPEAIRPGADLLLACDSGTSDGIFGPLLLLSAAPLINAPLVYLFRKAFAGAPESLSFSPHGVRLTGRF